MPNGTHDHDERYALRSDLEAVRNTLGGQLTELRTRLDAHLSATPSDPSPDPPPVPPPATDGLIGYGAANHDAFSGTIMITGGDANNVSNMRSALRDGAKVSLEPGLAIRGGFYCGENAQLIGLGRGSRIELTGGSGYTFEVRERNVRMRNLTLLAPMPPAGQAAGNATACIQCQGLAAEDFWFDHITFELSGDEGLSLWAYPTDAHAAKRGTVSYCLFLQERPTTAPGMGSPGSKGYVVGAQSGDQGSTIGSRNTEVTFYRTVKRSSQRGGYVKHSGKIHEIECVNARWQVYGMQSELNGQVLSEGGIFTSTQGKAEAFRGNNNGIMAVRNALLLNGVTGRQNRASEVFTPPYQYAVPGMPTQADLSSRVAAAGMRDFGLVA